MNSAPSPRTVAFYAALVAVAAVGYYSGVAARPATVPADPLETEPPPIAEMDATPAASDPSPLSDWFQLLDNPPAGGFPELYAAVGDDEWAADRRVLILDAWSRAAPLSALAFFDPVSSEAERVAVYRSWADHDPEAALAQLIVEMNAEWSHHVAITSPEARSVLEIAARRAPLALLRFRQGVIPSGGAEENLSDQAQRWALETIARNDIDELRELIARKEVSTPLANEALGKMLAIRDLTEAREWVDTLAEGDREAGLLGIVQHIADSDPQLALEILGEIPPGGDSGTDLIPRFDSNPKSERALAVEANALERLIQTDPDAAFRWLETTDHSSSKSLDASVLASCRALVATGDPAGLVRVVAGIGDPEFRDGVLDQLASLWAEIDVGQAFDEALATTQGEQREALLLSIGQSWARHDAGSMLRRLAALPWPKEEKEPLLQQARQGLAETAPLDPLTWELIGSAPEPERASLKFDAVESAARTDVAFAQEKLAEISPRLTRSYAYAARAVAMELAAESPTEAARWSESFEDLGIQAFTLSGIIEIWAKSDPAGATAHVVGMEPGPVRNTILYSWAMAVEPTVDHLRWATSLGSPGVRDETVGLLAARLHPAIARPVLIENGYSADEAERLMQLTMDHRSWLFEEE